MCPTVYSACSEHADWRGDGEEGGARNWGVEPMEVAASLVPSGEDSRPSGRVYQVPWTVDQVA